ncbi:hypothetical protein TCAL_01502 [Tigriopus californicus]|uniref:Centrosomal protein of 290kDa coiled-coil region domain-containing protein n=1 Tax=Tigriopus californicus TaxID=6832 RepID=A0A553N9A9_TIGCA|nr:centrosomal protein of 290 kDa-like [Tigriopus californicus]XP_059089962.1 centrosomal protein of 290 kDa-like [Tigriopus californicus]TRY62027.1 hypothetical protein TCAL_01502 [Tigriopus californicus]
MPPRDGQGSEGPGLSPAHWDWIRSVSENESGSLEQTEDADKLWPLIQDVDEGQIDEEHLRWIFKASRRLLGHQKNVLLRKEKESKKKSREMEKRIKQLEKRSAGEIDEDTALEDLRRTEEDLRSAEREIQDLERTVGLERVEKDDLEAKVKRVKDENQELKREIVGLKEAVGSISAVNDSEVDDREDAQRAKILEDEIRLKNKHIHQLIQDIEETEKEMGLYQDKVVELKDQLTNATKEINGMANAYNQTQEMAQGFNDLVESLQSENNRLRTLLEEYHGEKKQWEMKETEIKDELEKRVEESMKILEEKEATIEELTARLNQKQGKRPSVDFNGEEDQPKNASILSRALLEREEQIEKLKDELSRAAGDLAMSSEIISKLKGPKDNQVDPLEQMLLQVRGELHQAEERISELVEDVKDAQETAQDKTEELMDIVAKMRAYERGEYGLEQALDEIKAFKRQLKLRDKQIRELTHMTNELQHKSGQINEENQDLREQLGLGPRSSSSKTDEDDQAKPLEYRAPPYKALMQVMQKDIERLEEERIQLKCENRKLARQLGHKAADLMLDPDDLKAVQDYATALRQRRFGLESNLEDVLKTRQEVMDAQRDVDSYKDKINGLEHDALEMRNKFENLMEENDNLRRSLQEVLESIRTQDAQSDVKIQSESLEQVIAILDARHLWGNYHPAMGLKAKIERLEGMNTELRDQLRKARIDEDKALIQVQKMTLLHDDMTERLEQLESRGVCLLEDIGQKASLESRRKSISALSPTGSLFSGGVAPELAGKLNSQLLQVLHQLNTKEELIKSLEDDVGKISRQMGVAKHQMGLLYEEYHDKKTEWAKERKDQANKIALLEESLESAKVRTEEYDRQLQVIKLGGPDSVSKMADTARSVILLKSNEAIMIRRYKAMEESEDIHRKECTRLREDMVKAENAIIERVGLLQRYKDMASFKIEALQRQLAESVPSAHLDAANREFADVTAKYRDLLQKQKDQTMHERHNQELQLKISHLISDKERFGQELQSTKEKILSLDSVVKTLSCEGNPQGIEHQIESLSNQLVTLEMKEMNERQKAQHADAQMKLAKSQAHELEKRLEMVEAKFSEVTRSNMELQRTERELRDQIVTSIPVDQFNQLKKKTESLEASENELKIERDKLREVAEIARNQIQLFETKKIGENLELEALRHEVIDLQTQTDEKVLIGKLHRQIIALQMKENEFLLRNKTLEGKISRLESQLFRLNKRADEKEDLAIQVRSQAQIRAKTLCKVIQDLRRQFSGSIPLSKQEKITKIILEMNEEKTKLHSLLKSAENKANEAEITAEELNVKLEGVDELLATLKRGAKTNQILDWKQRMEELRLRDLRSRRCADQWKEEVEFLANTNRSQSIKIEQMEEEIVRLENQMEQRQLDWESQEVELEALDNAFDTKNRRQSIVDGADSNGTPNPDLPLAKQLEHSMSSMRRYQQVVEDYKGKLGESRKTVEEVQRKLRDTESQVNAKDRIINDLRLQVPASVDRALAVASVSGSSGLSNSLNQDYESKQALNIAQSIVTSLRARLEQKEETLTRYENLLKQTREDSASDLKRRLGEITTLQISIRNQTQAFNELKKASMLNASLSVNQPSSSVIGQQSSRINELEDEIKELQASLTDLANQLVSARSDGDKHQRIANTRLKELEEMKENAAIEKQMLKHSAKQDADQLRSELNVFKQENLMLKDDISNLKEAQAKAPSAIMKSLVEKLRNDLAEKEKKQKSMARAITDLKQELLDAAGEGPSSLSDRSKAPENTEIYLLKKKLDEFTIKNEKMHKQISEMRSKETSLQNQIKVLKEELARKSTALQKLKEAKGSDGGGPGKVRFKSPEKESEELRLKIRSLEDRLKAMNQAEKPLEDAKGDDRALKNIEEVTRWDERKKWEHKVEQVKKKLAVSEDELSKLNKANSSLKEIISRLEREKLTLESKAKAAAKASPDKSKLSLLEKENQTLKEKITKLKHQELMNEQQGLETMKLRNKFLQERIESQERKISALALTKKAGGSSAVLMKEIEKIQDREKECQKQRLKLEEDNLKMKLKLEELSTPRLREAKEKLATLLLQQSEHKEVKEPLEQIRDLLGSAQVKEDKKIVKNQNTKEMKALLGEVEKLKAINEQLLGKITERDEKIGILQNSQKHPPQKLEVVKDEDKLINMEYVRQIEADLKRKSDLLSEVKVLLKNAADRERRQLSDLENLKLRMKLILETDPKTPSEILAKELRQTRLTVDRLQCEKRELEHQLQSSKST